MSPTGIQLKRYEQSLTRLLAAFDHAHVVYNRRHDGRLSGAPRHVQVMIHGAVAGLPLTVAVECRQQHRPVGISCVEHFVAKLEDLGADRGVLYSCAGFTVAAGNRAAHTHDPAVLAISIGEPAAPRIPRQRRGGSGTSADYAHFLRYPAV
ncbi:hypothetical protein J2S43_008415 [Catenuloplanes nepalensis]|uniref:Restriction endonuclease type IV Mrr domain-containing protein n=1 Tax=Catenuloplanes nepalensis TaxID=587533 RepID=A0ABT9N887_9ACTN|nr:restriction endonuclease [Catenuloplanes nepalensis]MDP9799903.1 hypothetical protein [Catenuloplanes nepalensis]